MTLKDKIIKQGLGADDLDDIIINAAAELASNSNNGGLDEQIDFLTIICGWSEIDILKAIKYREE